MSTGSSTAAPSAPGGAPTVRERLLGYRWTICALLFFATTINYMDRQVLGILAPVLQDIG
jgi:ACS family hexuronate transporter-like MFS transporter